MGKIIYGVLLRGATAFYLTIYRFQITVKIQTVTLTKKSPVFGLRFADLKYSAKYQVGMLKRVKEAIFAAPATSTMDEFTADLVTMFNLVTGIFEVVHLYELAFSNAGKVVPANMQEFTERLVDGTSGVEDWIVKHYGRSSLPICIFPELVTSLLAEDLIQRADVIDVSNDFRTVRRLVALNTCHVVVGEITSHP